MSSVRIPIGASIPILGILALVAWLLGCQGGEVAGGTGIGNPSQGTVTFALKATSGQQQLAKVADGGVRNPDSAFAVADLGGTVFTIHSSLANLGYVKFKLPDGIACSQDIESACEQDDIKVTGPFVVDLMSGTLLPEIGPFKVPAGMYRRAEMRLEALESGAPTPQPQLLGRSMIISGTFVYAGKTDRTFSISLDFDEEIAFESGSMSVKPDILNKFLLLFNVDEWMAKADITKCLDDSTLVLDPQGNLLIDKQNKCEGLEQVLKDGVKASGDLGNGH